MKKRPSVKMENTTGIEIQTIIYVNIINEPYSPNFANANLCIKLFVFAQIWNLGELPSCLRRHRQTLGKVGRYNLLPKTKLTKLDFKM